MHINNLYKDGRIFNFNECYAMEKIHGTSARLDWRDNKLQYHAGGMKHDTFQNLQDFDFIENRFEEEFKDIDVSIYGEAYGGKMQGMSETYGKEPMFIVFEVKIGDDWLNVPNSEDVANKLNLEFVPYNKIKVTIPSLNKERDLPSRVAIRRGIVETKISEGIVCKPLEDCRDSKGNRIIVKHKTPEFTETKTYREVSPEKLKIMTKAREIATEWVTPMRFSHVIDKFKEEHIIQNTGKFITAMIEDVLREGEGEIVVSKQVTNAICKEAGKLYKEHVTKV